MKARLRCIMRLGVLLLVAAAGFGQSNSLLSGSYAVLASVRQQDSFGETGGAVLSVLNFDGAGNITGTAVVKGRTGEPRDADAGSGAVEGTYAVNADGSGTATLQFTDFGFSVKLAMAITGGGKRIQFADGPGSTGPLSINPALQGAPERVIGAVPGAFFLQNSRPGAQASGMIPLVLNRTYNEGVSIYSLAAPATGSGPVTCPDGTSGNWSATIPSATVVMSDASGNFMMPVLISACGADDRMNYSGLANIVLTPSGMNLVLHLTGFFIAGSGQLITGGAPQGVYGFQLLGEPFPNASTGIMNFDGAGGVTASVIGFGGTAAFSGTYTTNPDGSGIITMSRNDAPSTAPPVTYAFAAAGDATTIYLLRTSGGATGGDVVSGIGHLQ